jgi:hypothetical protein
MDEVSRCSPYRYKQGRPNEQENQPRNTRARTTPHHSGPPFDRETRGIMTGMIDTTL